MEESPSMRARLAELGFDVAAVRSALDVAPIDTDDLEARLRTASEAGPLGTPVQRRPKRPGVPGNLFFIAEETEPAEHHARVPSRATGRGSTRARVQNQSSSPRNTATNGQTSLTIATGDPVGYGMRSCSSSVLVQATADRWTGAGRGRRVLMPGVLLFGCGHGQPNSAPL
jgi:hypothetical protein